MAASHDVALRVILRLIGSASLLAVIFVAVPYEWMNAIHSALGMGTLPDAPVVGYLARTTSAFYALLGGLFWVFSFDLPRHRPALIFLGAGLAALGAALLVVDWTEGMPLFWTLWEGPFLMVFGNTLLLLSRKVQSHD